jgi:tRNA 2-selenouridine synthase
LRPIVTYEELEKDKADKSILFVDVRSPKEYAKATIPGAVNIPVLDDEDRKEVGTLYVSGRIDEAKMYGINAIAPRLPEMFARYQGYVKAYDRVVIFCSRGGFRSNSIFSLLKSLGMDVYRLEGGYKGYRNHINKQVPMLFEKVRFVTLYGNTGSGKTAILHELKERGANILDLEGCANHRGSLLGSVGLERKEPNSQKMFESLLVDTAKNWQQPLIVFTEGESKRIGKVVLPPALVDAMRRGRNIKIEASLDYRIGLLKQDYVHGNKEEINQALDGLKQYVNAERVEGYKASILQNDFEAVIEDLLLSYYDPRYNYNKKEYVADFHNESPTKTAEAILEWAKNIEYETDTDQTQEMGQSNPPV